MEPELKSPNYSENLLFTLLGALTAVVISLGTFGVVDARTPASLESPPALSDFDARIFMGE
jgi:hypothetical protein